MSYDHILCSTLGFTASRDMDQAAREGVVANVLATLPQVSRYVTGGARGGDSFLGQWLYAMYPRSEHVVVVPVNRSQIDPWWEIPGRVVTVIEMQPGTDYSDRNAEIVEMSDALVGFPSYPEADHRSLRSGSWQTIRQSRRAGTLSQWHCVRPPYSGRIEKWLEARLAAKVSCVCRPAGSPVEALAEQHCLLLHGQCIAF